MKPIGAGARRKQVLPTLFDSGALITSAKFSIRGAVVLEHLLRCCRIAILPAIKRETVDVGLLFGYPDAAELERHVTTGRIMVMSAPVREPSLESVLTNLGLEDTDRAIIQALRASPKQRRLVSDDHRLFVTGSRLGLSPVFLPDLILLLTNSGRMETDLAQDILNAVRPRYTTGFVELTLKRLGEAI